jgi:hypothetical protein
VHHQNLIRVVLGAVDGLLGDPTLALDLTDAVVETRRQAS